MKEDLKQGYIKQPYPFPTKRYCQMLTLKVDEEGITNINSGIKKKISGKKFRKEFDVQAF